MASSSAVGTHTAATVPTASASGTLHSEKQSLLSDAAAYGATSKEMDVSANDDSSSLEEDAKAVIKSASAKAPDCGCNDDFVPASAKEQAMADNDIPSKSELEKAFALNVYDTAGKKHTFKSVVDREGIDKHFVIFIRHFFCGQCQQYLVDLNNLLPPSSLPKATAVTIIANGHPSYIETYKEITKCPYDLYVDPDNSPLYAALKLRHTLVMGEKSKYIKDSLMTLVMRSVAQGLAAGRNGLRGGNARQVGGEFLFVRSNSAESSFITNSAWTCAWAHRMKNTRNHTEVEDLRAILLGAATTNGLQINGIATKSAAAVNGTSAIPRSRVDAVRNENRLSRRLSARVSGLWRRDDAAAVADGARVKQQNSVNGSAPAAAAVKSEKANGKAPVLVETATTNGSTTAADTTTESANGDSSSAVMNGANTGTIRTVADSPRLV